MQDDDWAPTTAQWTKIRNKIDDVAAPAQNRSTIEMPQSPFRPMNPQGDGMIGPSALDAPARIPENARPVEMNPNAPMGKGQEQVKTPNIDTTAGNYESAFE